MTTVAERYQPHAGGQMQVHQSLALIKALWCGRRWGKSRCGTMEGVKVYLDLLRVPAEASLVPPIHIWTVVPTYKHGLQIWHELLSFIPEKYVSRVVQDEKILYLKGTPQGRAWALWELKTADNPSSLVTVGLDYLHVSEAQELPEGAWNALAPTLISPGRLHKAFLEGIPPQTKSHWFARMYDLGQEGKSDIESFHYTSYDNPMIPREQIDAQKEQLTEQAFRRQFLAEMTDEGEGYFGNYDACIEGELLKDPLPERKYVAGLDLGRRVDFTVLIVMDRESRCVVHHRRLHGGNWGQIQREIETETEHWDLKEIRMDSTGLGDPLFDIFYRSGLPVKPVSVQIAIKQRLMDDLAVAIQKRTIRYPYIPQLMRELGSVVPEKLPSGRINVKAMGGEHDDYVMALALAIQACQRPKEESVRALRYPQSSTYILWPQGNPSKRMTPLRTMKLQARAKEELRQRSDTEALTGVNQDASRG